MINASSQYANSEGNREAVDLRARELFELVRVHGPMSRSQMRTRTGVHPNLIGDAVALLLRWGLVRETEAATRSARGRPQVMLGLDPLTRRAVGIAIAPGTVSFASLRLDGRAATSDSNSSDLESFLARPTSAIRALLGDDVFSIGLTCTGFLDVSTREILLSSAARRPRSFSLEKTITALRVAAPTLPIRITNDMHALSARYVLENRNARGDTLLIGLDDGRVGASVLIDGKPNRGCVLAANELGHARTDEKTDRCYCGATGCIERVFTTAWLRARGCKCSLADTISRGGSNKALERSMDLVARAFANAGNFIRPNRVVLASPFASSPSFVAEFSKRLRAELMPVLRDRIAIEWWAMPVVQSAENAAWAGMSAWIEGESDA